MRDTAFSDHFSDLRARVALREGMRMWELAKQYDVDAGQIGTWKCAAIKNMAVGFLKRGFNREQSNEAAVDKLHSRTG